MAKRAQVGDGFPVAQEVTRTLQTVVCQQGLDPGALTAVEGDLEPLTRLPCVRSQMCDSDGPLATAAAVGRAVRKVLASWPHGPAREATERLLGVGPTRMLPRRDRRRAAREVLGVGEEHFRKQREGVLLTELASAMLLAGPPIPNGGDGGPTPESTAKEGRPRRGLPGVRGRSRLVVAVAVVTLVGAAAAAGVLIGGNGGSPGAAARRGSALALGTRPPSHDAGPLVPGDDSRLASENHPNGVTLAAHSHVQKTWRLVNTGTVTWRNRWLERESLSGGCRTPGRVRIPLTRPGRQVAVTVPVITGAPGVCFSTWKMTNRSGTEFFPNMPGGVNFLFHIH